MSIFNQQTLQWGVGLRGSFWLFSRITKLLGRTETRTRDRMCFQISPESIEQELRLEVCYLRQTDRLKENYSIDICMGG